MKNINFKDIINEAYLNFNKRNIDAILLLMSEDVLWPNGWEGGYVKGHKEVREYWTRQWNSINPIVEPMTIKENNKYETEVHQVVYSRHFKLLSLIII